MSLGVGDYLSVDVDTVGDVEDVNASVVDEVGIPDLLHRTEAQLYDILDFLAGDLNR